VKRVPEKTAILTTGERVYDLHDQVEGSRCSYIRVSQQIVDDFKEMVNAYVETIGLRNDLSDLKKDVESADGDKFGKLLREYTDKSKYLKMIIEVGNDALDMETFPFSCKKGPGIYEIKITNTGDGPVSFGDLFDKSAGATITKMTYVVERVRSMGRCADCDKHEVMIVNEMNGKSCVLVWSVERATADWPVKQPSIIRSP